MSNVDYSVWIGIWKTVKNGLVTLLPMLVALQVQVPLKYAWIPGIILYFIKNAIQVKISK